MTKAIAQLSEMVNQPEKWHFSDAQDLYAGVDLGTYKTIAIIVDETGRPRAASMRRTEVARSGLIIDYVGALNTARELMKEISREFNDIPLIFISSVTGYNIQVLKDKIWEILNK